MPFFKIPYYHDYISPHLARHLLKDSRAVAGVPGLVEIGKGGGLETTQSFRFLAELYEKIQPSLAKVLAQRIADRKFVDERVRACFEFNRSLGRDWLDPDYKTVIGLEDGQGRIVIGPTTENYCRGRGKPVAPLPEFLKGPHVTLFGPPDSAKMAINAMNAFHRKTTNEPAIVEKLLGAISPIWGADDEDSKTPLRADLADAAANLTACFEETISLTEGSKKYELAKDHLSLPIKRFPGLALPCSFLFYNENPIPLHLYDFALHLFRNWENPRALVFYVPKLENEEEAAYIHEMVATAEGMIKKAHPTYIEGSVRLMVVLENPRAILRAHEIMDALYPYFAGASLGWHDYLASTARLFKEDSNYRIPVKADPGIVIKYIKASHHLLAETVGSRGGVRVGGMYGILPLAGDERSLQITLKGFIKDVVTQLKRQLNGFWVAHPDFVRLGLALVEAWRLREDGDTKPLAQLVTALLDKEFHKEILGFIDGPDIEGLDKNNPGYVRALLVADIKESDFIANNHPDEIRYNVFQSLQYLADWLSGNGCVALPTHVEGTNVRVMDDLATAERSRWEVWHEIKHGRFNVEDFLRIAHEEMNFIRRDLRSEKKITQVKWDSRTEKWYPIAFKLMLKLMTDDVPAEFATELLMPFTVESIRDTANPWQAVTSIDSAKFNQKRYVADFDRYFEICGSQRFAKILASKPIEDAELARKTVLSFSVDEIKEAASFHGNIGDAKKILDARAAAEQGLVLEENEVVREELAALGTDYLKKFGFKFLISAQGKSATEISTELKRRMNGDSSSEIANARAALWEISRKRLQGTKTASSGILDKIETLRTKHQVDRASISIAYRGQIQNLALGACTEETQFEIASLTKTIASALALEYFRFAKIPISTSVNDAFRKAGSEFRLTGEWAADVQLKHLMNHTALNMHYLNGFPATGAAPPTLELIQGNHGYEPVKVLAKPGTQFHYSGGGFLVLEHLIETLEGRSVQELTEAFFESLKLQGLTFNREQTTCVRELDFPAFAAGAFGTSAAMMRFLVNLESAFHSIDGSATISHDTAVQMLYGIDRGAKKFMGCNIGLGVFIAEAGENRLMIHQGANDGFRSLFVHCFDGPDRGKGMVLACTADHNGVPFIAEVAREIFDALEFEGVDFGRLENHFDSRKLKQEEIVNAGYKALLFNAFVPDLPEAIVDKGALDPLAKFNLATEAKVTQASNQKFARAENLISPHLPVFDPGLFGRQGKIMDSWETVRHNADAFDQLTIELKKPSKVQFISLSTKYHDGNHAEFIRLEGLDAKGAWQEVIPKTPFVGHALMQIKLSEIVAASGPFSQVRIEMYPDGGVSRLGLYETLPPDIAEQFSLLAKPIRFDEVILKSMKPLTIPYRTDAIEIQRNQAWASKPDWASAAFGGSLIHASNEHYGPAAQVISPYQPIHMFDGLESARSRKPGHHEEVTIRLGKPVRIAFVELDFKFFVNNNPASVSVDAQSKNTWTEIVPKTDVKAYGGNRIRLAVDSDLISDSIRLSVYPDGGVHRVRVFERTPLA